MRLFLNTKTKQKQNNKLCFLPEKAKKASAEGKSPLQELEEGPRSKLYLLVI